MVSEVRHKLLARRNTVTVVDPKLSVFLLQEDLAAVAKQDIGGRADEDVTRRTDKVLGTARADALRR